MISLEEKLQGIAVVFCGPGVAAAAAPSREILVDKAVRRTLIRDTVTLNWGRRDG